jgi:hypothetical protein
MQDGRQLACQSDLGPLWVIQALCPGGLDFTPSSARRAIQLTVAAMRDLTFGTAAARGAAVRP